jgi:hypothetical protein
MIQIWNSSRSEENYYRQRILIKSSVLIKGPPLWSSGQRSWLKIQRSGFDSRCYQIFWEVVGLERGPLSLVSTVQELLERKSSGSGLEIREYGRRNPSRWSRGTLYPQKFALASLTSGGRSVGIVRLRTQATEFTFSISKVRPDFLTFFSFGYLYSSYTGLWHPEAYAHTKLRKHRSTVSKVTWQTHCHTENIASP